MTIDNLAELTDSTDGGMREKWENSRSDLGEPRLETGRGGCFFSVTVFVD